MRIFINYDRDSHPDHDRARQYEKWLHLAGHGVFRDESGIPPGEGWALVIMHEIESCDVMVSLVSNSSLKSGWALNEIDLAQRLGKQIIPVLLEPLDSSLEFTAYRPRLMSIQHIRATGDPRRDRKEITAAIDGPETK